MPKLKLKKQKLKTHKGLLKRYWVTKTGKVQRTRPGSRHLLSHKSGDRKRKLHKRGELYKAYQKTIKRLLAPALRGR